MLLINFWYSINYIDDWAALKREIVCCVHRSPDCYIPSLSNFLLIAYTGDALRLVKETYKSVDKL